MRLFTADIWEPLLTVADLAGGDWPKLGREAAVGLTLGAQENNPIGALFLDILMAFSVSKAEALWSRTLIEGLGS